MAPGESSSAPRGLPRGPLGLFGFVLYYTCDILAPLMMPIVSTLPDPAALAEALRCVRFTAANERRLQDGIEQHLAAWSPGLFQREYRLSPSDRPDFFAPASGLVVEIKWAPSGGSVAKVAAQLSRYAEHAAVRAILVCSPSRRVISQIPTSIGRVPVHGVVLTTGF